MLGLGMADDRFDQRTAAEFAFDGLGGAASTGPRSFLGLVVEQSIVAAIAADRRRCTRGRRRSASRSPGSRSRGCGRRRDYQAFALASAIELARLWSDGAWLRRADLTRLIRPMGFPLPMHSTSGTYEIDLLSALMLHCSRTQRASVGGCTRFFSDAASPLILRSDLRALDPTE